MWSQAGRVFNLSEGPSWFSAIPEELLPDEMREKIKNTLSEYTYGDRMQEIVIIGKDMDEELVSKALDYCLMSEDEIKISKVKESIASINNNLNQENKEKINNQNICLL